MAKITYENKEFLNKNENIADKNKVNDTDLNELKNVVNENDDNVGDLSNLNTTNKDSLVGAINEVNQKNVITAYFTSYKSTGNLSPVTNLNTDINIGNKLQLNSGQNGVKIGQNVHNVLISGWAFCNSNLSGQGLLIGIMKNGNIVEAPFIHSNWQQAHSNNDNITMVIAPTLVAVSENDIVNIGLAINGDTTHTFSRGCVTVEVIN